MSRHRSATSLCMEILEKRSSTNGILAHTDCCPGLKLSALNWLLCSTTSFTEDIKNVDYRVHSASSVRFICTVGDSITGILGPVLHHIVKKRVHWDMPTSCAVSEACLGVICTLQLAWVRLAASCKALFWPEDNMCRIHTITFSQKMYTLGRHESSIWGILAKIVRETNRKLRTVQNSMRLVTSILAQECCSSSKFDW